LKEYRKDPSLSNYSIVIIDEAHERKIDTDIAFGVMKQALKKRPDLKVSITRILFKAISNKKLSIFTEP
jgi:ATP-dependent RNA helicase DHX8/PRP22